MKSWSINIMLLLTVLLLYACGGQKQSRLILIVENTPKTSLENNAQPVERERKIYSYPHYLRFVDGKGVSYLFLPRTKSDTLTVDMKDKEVLEVYCRYGAGRGTREEYMLLQANDTVVLRYSDVENEKPSYTSLCSESNTELYRLQCELQAISLYSDGKFMNDLGLSYVYVMLGREFPENDYSGKVKPAVLEEAYYASVARMEQAVDSAILLKLLPPAYERYYRYHIWMQKVIPFRKQQLTDHKYPMMPEQYAFFSDNYQGYISYRDYVRICCIPYAKNGTEWSYSRYYYTDTTGVEKNTWWNPDDRVIFDRLAYMRQSGDSRISDITYDMMLYSCLDNISYIGIYSEVDKASYLAKYKALTTRFLEEKEVEASSVLGFPFKMLYFSLQLNLCVMVLFALYRLLLRGSASFIACRVFLVLGLLLSVLAASQLVSADVVLPGKLWAMGKAVRVAGWAVAGMYGFALLCLLYSILRQLARVVRMRNDSWRISENGYLLCILKDIVTAPVSFFRMVFISWNDFFNPKDSKSIEQLIVHEVYHVRQWHSVDMLLLLLLRFFCWFNPFFRKYAAELKLVNEYAADRSVVRRVGAQAYVESLNAHSCNEGMDLSLGAYYLGGNCSKRIEMVKRYGQKRSKDALKLLFLLPAFAALSFLSPHLIFKLYSLPAIAIGIF